MTIAKFEEIPITFETFEDISITLRCLRSCLKYLKFEYILITFVKVEQILITSQPAFTCSSLNILGNVFKYSIEFLCYTRK